MRVINETDKERIQALADIIQNLLQQVDLFTIGLNENDFELLDITKKELTSRISYKQSAMPLFMAIGADSNTTEDEMKLKTLESLIELIKIRIEFKKKMVKMKEEAQSKQEVINLFRSMGII